MAYASIILSITLFIVRGLLARGAMQNSLALYQAKMDFFTNISHEIRTHMTLILAPLEKSLSLTGSNKDIHRHLEPVQNNASRLLTLVTELMNFRRMDSKMLKLHVKESDLVILAINVLSAFEDKQKGIKISVKADPDQIFLFSDPVQLEKCLFNLLSNAFKFVKPSGSIQIEINETGKYKGY